MINDVFTIPLRQRSISKGGRTGQFSMTKIVATRSRLMRASQWKTLIFGVTAALLAATGFLGDGGRDRPRPRPRVESPVFPRAQGLRLLPSDRADPDRRPARRRELESSPLDRRLRRHPRGCPTSPSVSDPGQDALGRHLFLRRCPPGRTSRLGHAHQARLRHLPGQRLRDLHRSRRRQPRILRDRNQCTQYRMGPVPQEGVPRRRPGDQRVGDPWLEDGRPCLRHAQ